MCAEASEVGNIDELPSLPWLFGLSPVAVIRLEYSNRVKNLSGMR
jgi:hypothetical protein